MTTEILSQGEGIDWSKPQWVISGIKQLVYTNGKHDGINFSGSVLPHESSPQGEFCVDWDKSCFKPIPTEGLVIKIKNK
jgi:hypothetical protein